MFRQLSNVLRRGKSLRDLKVVTEIVQSKSAIENVTSIINLEKNRMFQEQKFIYYNFPRHHFCSGKDAAAADGKEAAAADGKEAAAADGKDGKDAAAADGKEDGKESPPAADGKDSPSGQILDDRVAKLEKIAEAVELKIDRLLRIAEDPLTPKVTIEYLRSLSKLVLVFAAGLYVASVVGWNAIERILDKIYDYIFGPDQDVLETQDLVNKGFTKLLIELEKLKENSEVKELVSQVQEWKEEVVNKGVYKLLSEESEVKDLVSQVKELKEQVGGAKKFLIWGGVGNVVCVVVCGVGVSLLCFWRRS